MKKLSSIMLVSALSLGVAGVIDAKPQQGGTLTVPLIAQTLTDDFNPFSNAQEDMVRGTMFEPLWANNVLQGSVNFRLATGFKYAKDLMSMDIKIRKGMKWSDGQELNADDVVFSLNLGNEDKKLDKGGLWGNGLLKSVEQTGSHSLKVHFTRKDSTADWYMPDYYIVPQHIWQDVEDKITFRNATPVGSGPMTEVKSVKSTQVEICRNPNYYKANKGLPYLDCIKFRQYSDNSQIQPALINGQIDWGSNFIADIDKTYVQKDPNAHGYWYPANDLINIYLNTREKPFSDIAFRKAFSMSLDREAIVDLAAYGYPTVEKHVTGIGEFFKAHFNDKVNKKYDYLAEYNPKAAKALLKEAGYKDVDGDGFLENPDGSAIDFKIHVVNGWTDWVQTVQMVSEYLADIGIKGTVQTVDWSVYDSALKEGTYQASINWSGTGADPIVAYRDYFHTGRVGQIWHAGHGVHSDTVDALIDEYGQTTSKKRRKAILAELMEFTAENLPFVPVFSNPTWFQYNSSRIGGWPTADNSFVQPVFYDHSRKLILFENLYLK